jgi:hypothetical protein
MTVHSRSSTARPSQSGAYDRTLPVLSSPLLAATTTLVAMGTTATFGSPG